MENSSRKLASKAARAAKFALKFPDLLFELLFPKSCIGCGAGDDFLCERCLKEIEINSLQVCCLCQKAITKNGELCGLCKSQASPPLNRVLVCGKYQDELLAKAIHLFKYKFIRELDESLGKLQSRTLRHFSVPIPDLIIPVPLHKRRLRWRGYNQSALLANQVAKSIAPGLEIPVAENVIFRSRHTPPQMKIKKLSQRVENVSGAFALFPLPQNFLKGKNILLVDDVCTTGSTLFECAKVLSAKRPKSISAIVLARQS